MSYTFKTHNDDTIDVCGTSLSGYLVLERSKLVEIFGEPILGSGDDKVQCSWDIEVTDENGDSGVITIYDWKNNSAAAMADDYKNWHVGGSSPDDARVLNELISEVINPDGDYGMYTQNY